METGSSTGEDCRSNHSGEFPSLFNWKFKREEFRISNLSELGLVSVTSLLTSPLFRILTSIDI